MIPGVPSWIVDTLGELVEAVGIETIIKLVTGKAGGPDKVRAILAAEYAANDAVLDKLEEDKLAGHDLGPGFDGKS